MESGFMDSGAPTFFFLVIAFAFFFMYLPTKWSKRKALRSIERASSEIAELTQRVLVVTSDSIPGKVITSVCGHVTGTSRIEASCPEETDASEWEARLDLMKNAFNMGANAVIDARLSTSTHERLGSQWMVSQIHYTGTAVIAENKPGFEKEDCREVM